MAYSENGYPATLFIRPKGNRVTIHVRHVYDEDAQWMRDNGIELSIEDIGNDFVLYFDYGKRDEEGEPVEHIEFAKGRLCEIAITDAVKKLKEIKKA